MNSTTPGAKMSYFKMRCLEGQLFKTERGQSTFTQLGARRMVIDLTGDDSEEDIERITQVSSRQSAGSRFNQEMAAEVKQERTEGSVSSVEILKFVDEDVTGDKEQSGSVDSEMEHSYVPVEGCLRAQLEALALQLQRAQKAPGPPGRPPMKTIRLTSSEVTRQRWGENGNPNDYLIVKVQARKRSDSFEVAALRKHLSEVSEAFADTQAEVRRLQWKLSRQLAEAAVRMNMATKIRELEEAGRIKILEEARKAKQLKKEKKAQKLEAGRIKRMEEARKTKQLKQEKNLQEPEEDRIKKVEEARKAKQLKQTAQELGNTGMIKKLEQASKAKLPNQGKPMGNKRANKF